MNLHRRRRGLPFFGAFFWLLVTAPPGSAGELPEGYWSLDQSQPLIDKTGTIELTPKLSHLSAAEMAAVDRLLAAGRLLHDLYEAQKHPQAASSLVALQALHARENSPATANLVTLFRLFKGPIATTLENERTPFLPVAEELPGRNVYPGDAEREALERHLSENPAARRDILGVRTVVRATQPDNVTADLAVLQAHPGLAGLHADLAQRIESASRNGAAFYAVPYSVAYADTLARVSAYVREAARLLRDTDPDLAGYLRLRAFDLLTDDYEGGDAAWVSGSFGNLNAQIGSYETYDDKLFGAKSFFALSILVRDLERTQSLNRALGNIQEIEDRLPYDAHKQVRGNIPVGVYNVVADFGQSRGSNTASILPNDPDHARKYGRTILMRYNVMSSPAIFQRQQERYNAAMAERFHADLSAEAEFERTLWHEIGHYLGVGKARDGRGLSDALEDYADLLEEMKADLVSLFSASVLHEAGIRSDTGLRAIYASGIVRVLQSVKPRRDQPYATMQLMQWNYFLENGLLEYDARRGEMSIDYERYPDVVHALLAEVLELQAAGDPAKAEAFVERYGYWNDELHEVIATHVRDALRYRFLLVRYRAIDGRL